MGSSVATHCYDGSATRDTSSGLIHFTWTSLIVRELNFRLLFRNWIDWIDGGFSTQFESGRLGWWLLGMVSPAHRCQTSCPMAWIDDERALLGSKIVRFLFAWKSWVKKRRINFPQTCAYWFCAFQQGFSWFIMVLRSCRTPLDLLHLSSINTSLFCHLIMSFGHI